MWAAGAAAQERLGDLEFLLQIPQEKSLRGGARRRWRAEFLAPRLLLLGGGFFVGVFLLEALDAAGRVDEFLLAGEEGVAIGADFDADHFALVGGAGLERVPAGAVNQDGMIVGMNAFFHLDLQSSWPICTSIGCMAHQTRR